MPALQRGKSSEKGRESVPIPIIDCLVDAVAMVTGLGVPLLRRQLQQALQIRLSFLPIFRIWRD